MKNNQIITERFAISLGSASIASIVVYMPERIMQVIFSALIIMSITLIIDGIINYK